MMRTRLLITLPGLLVLATGVAAAQPPAQPSSSPMGGLTANRDQPVKIESTSLEVRDKSHMATFIGNVKMTQGDTTVQCKTLIVYYEDTSAPAVTAKSNAPAKSAPPAIAGPGGGKQQIKRMEAKGDVLVTQKDQTASGENGLFDVKANTVTLIGGVVVTQGQNILKGERMTVNLNTGITTVESSGKGPVSGVMFPNAQKDAKAAPPAAAAPAPAAPAAPPAKPRPLRIN